MTHAFQFGKRQNWRPDLSSNREARRDRAALCFHSVYRLYLRPDTVPSRWDTQSEPQGTFFREDWRSPEAKLAPLRTIPRRTDRRGTRARRKGTCPETLERASPSLHSQIESPPPQRTASQLQEGATPSLGGGHTAHRSTFRPRPSNTGHWPCLGHRAGTSRSNPCTPGDSTLRWPKGHCLQSANAYILKKYISIYMYILLKVK